jgi:hypothetical protein
MKTIITAAAVLFGANVSSTGICHGLDARNSDLNSAQPHAADVTGVQPSVGGPLEIYDRLSDGKADLFKGDGTQSRPSTGRSDIYSILSANPALQL